MKFDHQQFSKDMKLALFNYLEGEKVDQNKTDWYLINLENFNLRVLNNDVQKVAFWTNVYNAFTNVQIVKNNLQKSVWEKSDFFTDRALKIGSVFFSLDDMEHGILRRNGKRRNGKPDQFDSSDSRRKLMVENFDSRIHFALNCGSISCPPLAFYSEDNLEAELSVAESSFTEQEFLVDHEFKEITCSQIFVWYKHDFGNQFLNDPKLSHYRVIERPYEWKIQ